MRMLPGDQFSLARKRLVRMLVMMLHVMRVSGFQLSDDQIRRDVRCGLVTGTS